MNNRTEARPDEIDEAGHAKDPVHKHGPEDLSTVHEGAELNPKHHHPPNAETQGVWKILRYSTVGAIAAMVVIFVIAYLLFY